MAIIDVTATSSLDLTQSRAGNADLLEYTSVLGAFNAGKGFVLGQFSTEPPPPAANILNVTASQTIPFTQLADGIAETIGTATQSITFTQDVDLEVIKNLTAESTLSLTQTLVVPRALNLSADNTISFVQDDSDSGLLTRSAFSNLNLTQSNGLGETSEPATTNVLNFTQSASPGLFTRSAHNNLELQQSNNRFTQLTTAVALTASHTLSFSQTNNRILLEAGATALTASHTITFSGQAIFPILLTASSSLNLSQSNDSNVGKSSLQTIEFTQSPILNIVRNMTASSTIPLQQRFTYSVNNSAGEIVNRAAGGCKVTEMYSPFSGGSDTPPLPVVQPILTRKNDVEFFYPDGPIDLATRSITLRTPNFGDRDRTSPTRVQRESRGGSLLVYRDPIWPKDRTLVVDFSGVKDSEIEDILLFLDVTLGKKIGFRDWQGRVWFGFITTPDTPIIRQGTNRNDISIEILVDDQDLEAPQTASVLSINQSASVELIPV